MTSAGVSSGRLVPGYRARIVNERGIDVGDDESGRLIISGDFDGALLLEQSRAHRNHHGRRLARHRRHLSAATPRDISHYCGRSDDMLKVGGIWCSPFEIESLNSSSTRRSFEAA